MSSRYSKKKKHSKDERKECKDERIPTQWSGWEWKEDGGCYYRYRLDKYGNYEYDYDHEAPETNEYTAASDYQNSRSSETPRYAPTHDATYGEPNQAAFGASPVTTPDYTTSTYEDATAALGKLDLNKGKEREAEYATPVSTSYSIAPSVAQGMPTAPVVDNSNWNMETSNSSYGAYYAQNTGPYPQSSYPFTGQYPQNRGSSIPPQQQFYTGQSFQDSSADQSSFAPQGNNYHIAAGTWGLEDPLDPRFKIQKGSKFEVGKMFKILWAEPMGSNGTRLTDDGHGQSQKFGQKFIHKIRRFVVVKAFNGHCLCLPVMTYQRQGLTKHGAQPEHHAAIYSEKPVTYEDEGLTKKPIRVEMSNPKEKLDPISRINYAKVYTIEYNVKVYFIGRVHEDYLHQLIADYQNIVHPPPEAPGPYSGYGYEGAAGSSQ
ncbi:hypothetical protein BGZ57DRAFT_291368 [Hyaloscypha finlandica]|nr:hypothetical protein BGZ57DRAFT_291368 [Hyaloscypha finlandica]